MANFTVTAVRPRGLELLLAGLGTVEARLAQRGALKGYAPIMQQHLQENSPDQGRFAAGWGVTPMVDGQGLDITNTFKYAKYVEQGTAPHLILPVNAKALSWVPRAGGFRVFAKVVHHPGFAGRHVFWTVAEQDRPLIMQEIFSAATQTLMDYGAA